MHPARAWLLASRPKTLPAAVAPVIVGTSVAYAAGSFRLAPGLAALLGALLLQIGANFANDLFDFEKGADDERRIGPLRVTQAGIIAPRAMRTGIAVVFAIALLVGVYLAWAAGWPIVAIGIASIVAALAYTGGPYPLAYHGLGDVFVMIFFGFVAVCGTAFVHAGFVPGAAWPAALATGALATAILAVNNVRDARTDRSAGKLTIPARYGREAGVVEYAVLLLLAYSIPVSMLGSGQATPWVLLVFATLPLAVRLLLVLARREDGPGLNAALAGTAQLMVLYAALFATGIAAGR